MLLRAGRLVGLKVVDLKWRLLQRPLHQSSSNGRTLQRSADGGSRGAQDSWAAGQGLAR